MVLSNGASKLLKDSEGGAIPKRGLFFTWADIVPNGPPRHYTVPLGSFLSAAILISQKSPGNRPDNLDANALTC